MTRAVLAGLVGAMSVVVAAGWLLGSATPGRYCRVCRRFHHS